MKRVSSLLAVAIAVACSDAFQPTIDNVAGDYTARTFTITDSTGTTDVLKAGGVLTLSLVPRGTTAGYLYIPGAVAGGSDVVADMVLEPKFANEDIDKEKSVILEEIRMTQDNPEDLVHELFTQNFWTPHALGKPILGTPETVSSFTRETLDSWFRHWYAPNHLVITAAGRLTHQQLVDLVAERFAKILQLAKGDDTRRPAVEGIDAVSVRGTLPGARQLLDFRHRCRLLRNRIDAFGVLHGHANQAGGAFQPHHRASVAVLKSPFSVFPPRP